MKLHRRKIETDGDFFRRMRHALGMTQFQLAKEIGVHYLTPSKWERNVDPIPPRRMQQIRDLLANKGN